MPNLRKIGRVAGAALVAVLAFSAAGTATEASGGLKLSEQWFRFIMPSLPAAGYFTLSNPTAAPVTLSGASSAACGDLMLHKSVRKNGSEGMAMVPSVEVPPHGSVRFAPGGYHLMCKQPAAAMRPGKTVTVTLKFGGGQSLSAPFPVRNATGK